MATAAIPVRGKGQTTCAHHKGRQLELYCKTCEELVCLKCLSTIHNSHSISELNEITAEKKRDISNFIDTTEHQDLVQIRKYITSADTLLKENDSTFEKIAHQLRMQTEKLKQELDKLSEETLTIYMKMKEDNAKLIQKYKKDLDIYNEQLKQQMQKCKTTLQQGSDIEIHDTKCVIDSQLHLPAKPDLGTVTFTPNTNPQNNLEQALGKVVTSGQGQTSIEHDHSSDGHLQSCTVPVQTGDKGDKAVTRTTLLTETRVVEEWRSPCSIWFICPTIDDKAWTMSSNTLTLLDRKGKMIQQVTHKDKIKDISLSPTTHRLWACDKQNNILELVSGRLTKRFRTNEEPICICVTSSDHVLVGMSTHISKYTTQGQVVLTTEATRTGKPLVYTPWRIIECPVTNNVAVIDHSVSRVVVVDTDFRELFVYRGDIHSTYQQTPQTGDEPFNPRDIVYDSQGNIIIGDYINQRLLILSGRGEVLRILHTGRVWTVGIDRHDIVWSVFGNPFSCKVKLLQYISNT